MLRPVRPYDTIRDFLNIQGVGTKCENLGEATMEKVKLMLSGEPAVVGLDLKLSLAGEPLRKNHMLWIVDWAERKQIPVNIETKPGLMLAHLKVGAHTMIDPEAIRTQIIVMEVEFSVAIEMADYDTAVVIESELNRLRDMLTKETEGDTEDE